MRIFVASDTHGRWGALCRALEETPDAEHVIFLGDGEDDVLSAMTDFPRFTYHRISGNCDLFSSAPGIQVLSLAGKRIFCTHGHTYSVKYGYDRVIAAAHRQNCDICLFGHTHEPYCTYEDGLYIMNPGSLGNPRGRAPSYGVIDITDAGIVCTLREL